MKSLYSGSKDYYKPATVKSMNAYADPMRINGVRAIIVCNSFRRYDDIALYPNERNAINKAKFDELEMKYKDMLKKVSTKRSLLNL